MDLLVFVAVAVVIGVCYGVVALSVLINFDVVPRPEPSQLAVWLDWHRSPRVHLLPASQVANPAWPALNPAGGFRPGYGFGFAVILTIPLAIGEGKPNVPGGFAATGTAAHIVKLSTETGIVAHAESFSG